MTIQHHGGRIRIPEITQGDRMRKARELTGLSREEFAQEIGVSPKTVFNAESGAHGVRKITMNAWALATGVPTEWMQTGIAPTDDGGGDPDGADDETRTRNILLARWKANNVVHLHREDVPTDLDEAA